MDGTFELDCKEVREILKCPICQEGITSPIYQCNNGHLICSQCIIQISGGDCPVCRVPMPDTNIRCLVAEQLTQNFVVECKNNSHGCKVNVKMSEFQQHLLNCQFRANKFCKLLGSKCEEEIYSGKFLEHIKVKHVKTALHLSKIINKGLIRQEFNFQDAKGHLQKKSEPIFIFYGDNLLVITSKFSQREDGFTWSCVAFSKFEDFENNKTNQTDDLKTENFQIEIRIENDSKSTKMQWSVPVTSLSPNCIANAKDETENTAADFPTSFYVPMKALRKFVNSKEMGTLSWNLQIQLKLQNGNSSENSYQSPEIQSVVSNYEGSSDTTDGGQTEHCHIGITCDSCQMHPIIGTRFKCIECPDYDLCETCEGNNVHDHHLFIRQKNRSMYLRTRKYFDACQRSANVPTSQFISPFDLIFMPTIGSAEDTNQNEDSESSDTEGGESDHDDNEGEQAEAACSTTAPPVTTEQFQDDELD